MIAMPLVGIRLIYAIATVLKYTSTAGGSLAIQVVLGILLEFLIMITYLFAGICTCNLAHVSSKKAGVVCDSDYTHYGFT